MRVLPAAEHEVHIVALSEGGVVRNVVLVERIPLEERMEHAEHGATSAEAGLAFGDLK